MYFSQSICECSKVVWAFALLAGWCSRAPLQTCGLYPVCCDTNEALPVCCPAISSGADELNILHCSLKVFLHFLCCFVSLHFHRVTSHYRSIWLEVIHKALEGLLLNNPQRVQALNYKGKNMCIYTFLRDMPGFPQFQLLGCFIGGFIAPPFQACELCLSLQVFLLFSPQQTLAATLASFQHSPTTVTS